MSYCSRCGAQVSGAYCSNCGAKIEQTTASVGRSHSSYLEEPTFKLPEEHGATGKNMQTAKPDTSQYKLGWHKFLIYFFLWAEGIVGISNGVQELQLAGYYGIFGLFGLINIALGVFAIVVRFRLAGFKKNSPKLVTLLNVIYACLNLVETLVAASIVGFENLDFYFYSGIISAIPIAVITWRYYSSRQELFIY